MADSIKYFAHIKAKSSCPECGNPIFLNGPTNEITCSYCFKQLTINKDIPIDLVLTPFNEISDKQKRDANYNCLSYEYSFNKSYPKCPQCEEDIPIEKLTEMPNLAVWKIKCEKCNNIISAGRIPKWIKKKIPYAKIAINALFGFDKQNTNETATEGIVFSCPKCGGALNVDGSERVIKCEYCTSDVYIPDSLWLRLHPVKTVETWYIGYTHLKKSMFKEKIDPLRSQKSKNNKKLKKIQKEIDISNDQYEQLGFFKKKEKKEIEEKIKVIKLELSELNKINAQLNKQITQVRDQYE